MTEAERAAENDRMPSAMQQRRSGRTGRRPGSPGTRDRILTEARLAFAESGYAAASVRHIAARAAVDPALIHHYFGTKERLFLATVQAPINPADLVARIANGPIEEMGLRLVDAITQTWESDAGPALVAILRRVLADPAETRTLQEYIAGQVVHRVLAAVGPDPAEVPLRAALVSSQILGLVAGRYLIGLADLDEQPRQALVAAIGATVQGYLTGPLGPEETG
jgi:AcrR family transcriptional regulator